MRYFRELTADEAAAIQRFADAHGRKWKNELSMVYWYNARQWTGKGSRPGDGCILHGIRNGLGPTWLYDVCTVKPVKAGAA